MSMLREALSLTGGGIVSLVGAGGKTSLMYALAEEFDHAGETVLVTTTTKIARPNVSQAPALIIGSDPAVVLSKCEAALRAHRKLTAAADWPEAGNKLLGFSREAVTALWQSGLFRWVLVEADGAARRPLKAPADHEPVIAAESRWVIGLAGLSAVGKPFTEQWVFRPHIFERISGLSPGKPITPAAAARALSHPSGVMKGAPDTSVKMAFLNQADDSERRRYGEKIAAHLGQSSSGLDCVIIGQLQPKKRIDQIIALDA